MRILISNDDGIYSPGLQALAEVAAGFAEVRIVAPDVEQSSASHSITATRPVFYRRTPLQNFDAYRVNGTPADCVMLGVNQWKDVDVVLSGINLGTNLGNAVWHSGTLAAAKQAALLGLRGIAFSTPATESEPDFAKIKPWVERALRLVLEETDFPLVNINVPPEGEGLAWTRQAVQHYDGLVVPGKDPMGRVNYWFSVSKIEEVEEGTDRWAMARGLVSMTPLRLDLTDEARLKTVLARGGTERAEVGQPAGREKIL
ncbi:MAG TPA: 5'/3'-nucleotidase SurE [Opitutus sp.]|nr:5'/3'-nucleotidase SurE [Opitutus sp.]